MTRRCDRCEVAEELALDFCCFSYLCVWCWGPGRQVCGECEAHLYVCERCRLDLAPSDQRASS